VTVTGLLMCQPAISRAVNVSVVITQTVEQRVITEEFHVTTSCPAMSATGPARSGGSARKRFKAGPAKVTTRAVDAADPLPDDTGSITVDVDLVRAAA
jgi:hypothetical protein